MADPMKDVASKRKRYHEIHKLYNMERIPFVVALIFVMILFYLLERVGASKKAAKLEKTIFKLGKEIERGRE